MTVRWGVIGPGGIAERFAAAMSDVDDGRIVAVASRSTERADVYGDRHDVPHRYGGPDAVAELVGDDEVDAVYVATPNQRHLDDAVAGLDAGRAVLVEKPIALDVAQAERMAAVARDRGVFLMEALWSRFLPGYRILRDVLDEGRIGTPLVAEADFGFVAPVDPTHRLFAPELGGGALLDLGIYAVHLCSWALGEVEDVAARGVIGSTDVDEIVTGLLRHRDGGLGVVKAAVRASLSCTARISGSDGWIAVPAFMHCPTELTVAGGGRVETIDASFTGDGLRFEIDEVHRCLAAGRVESDVMPLAASLAQLRVLDAIRAQIRATR